MGKPERLIGPEFEYDGFANGWNACVLAWEQWEKERPARWLCVPIRASAAASAKCIFVCSNCGVSQAANVKHDVCPHCGRKMEG